MAGIHFDITADNSNFQAKLEQVKDGVSKTSKVIQQLGKNFDVSSVESKVIAVNKVIKDNESSIRTLNAQLKQWSEQAQDAFNNNDMNLFNSITKDIENQVEELQELISETEEYKSALSVIESNAGLISSQAEVSSPQLFKTQEEYEYVKNLRDEIENLQSQISQFDGSEQELQGLKSALSSVETELRDCEVAAANAASQLGEELGGRASEASSKLYELNISIEKQSKVVDELSESVEKAKEELDSLQGSSDTSAIELAQVKYDALSISLQNANNQLRNLQAEQIDASSNWANVSVEVERTDSVLVKLLGGQEKYNTIMANMPPLVQSAASGITGMTGAAKAFIATPIGAVLAALILTIQSLSTWFNSTVEGQLAFAEASGYVSGILGQLKEIVIAVGKAIYDSFANPKQAVLNLWESIKTNIVNRFKAVGESASALGKIIKSAFTLDTEGVKEGVKELTNSLLQFGTGVENLTDKTSKWAKSVHEAAKSTAEINRQSKELEIEVSEWEKQSAELDKVKAEAQQKMYNTNLSSTERKKALEAYKNAVNEQLKKELEFQDRRIALQSRKMDLTSNTIEDENQLRKLQADRVKIEVNAQRELASLQRRANTIEKGGGSEEEAIKQRQKLSDELLSLIRKNQQDEINLMKEGTEKKLAQIDLDYQKELDAIEKQREEWKKEQKGKLTDEQETQLSASEENAFKAYQNSVDEVNKAKLESDRKAWQEYFIEFGNYQEKRKNLIQKYDDEISKLQSNSPEYAIKVAEKNQAIEQLDEQYGKSTKAMADLFEDASNKSVSAIRSIIDKYETLVEYLSGESDVTIDLLKEFGFTDKDIEKIDKGEISIKDVTDAIKGLKNGLKGKSPWQSFVTDLDKGIKAIKNAGSDTKKVGQGITDIGNSVTSFAPALSAFGSNIANIFGIDDSKITGAIDALGGLGQTAVGVGQIMSGDIVGGAMSAVSGISSVVSALDGMFGADYSRYNKMVEEYNQLNEIWDELIDKKLEYIGISYGSEANKVGKEALELAEKSIESYRILGKERLNAGASVGSHSIGIRMRKGMSKEGWNELRGAAKSIGFDYGAVAEGRMTGLFDLTAEQLDKLKQEAPTFWAKMDGDVREYLDNIIEGEERIQDIQNQVKEQLTQVSFDSVFDSFVDMLMDMDSSAEDFSKNFEQYLQRSILTTMVGNKYRNKLQAWYDSFAKANDDKDGITKEEMDRSQAEWDAIVAEALAEREALKNAMGWTGSTTQQQNATAGGFETMSQDTATELNGRFTALQIAGEEIKNRMQNAANGISSLVTISTDGNAIMSNILNQHVITNGYLEDIVKYTKPMLDFGAKFDKMISIFNDKL